MRKAFQAAFCIDVRSEVYRRALETVCPDAETIGFAGFFGFPIEYVPIGRDTGGAQCPVLLKPAFVVCEAVAAWNALRTAFEGTGDARCCPSRASNWR
ncbi:putative inorganic carbon transporter subunit DabA [Xanthomonas oryzae]|uniref:putative inorganic carbon transporter subunit DabA n=1 Tax=Xanthomonas oryzae TaxID=347 RepID=UPI003F6E0D41